MPRTQFAFIALSSSAALLLSTGAARAQFQQAATDLGAAYNAGAAPIGVPAVAFLASSTGLWATGDHPNPSVYNPYNQPSTAWGNSPFAGRDPDFNWVADAAPQQVGQNQIWVFGVPSNQYFLYPAIDHTPLPNEALESTLWGSNDGGATWLLGTVVEVYELGWNAGVTTLCDNGATRWTFGQQVNMVTAVPELNQGNYHSNAGGDYEIDAIMGVPSPGAAAVVGLGVLLPAVRRRR